MKNVVCHTKQIEIMHEQSKLGKEEALKRSQFLQMEVTQNKS